MVIINKGADYSDCGIGKYFPLTNEIKELLQTGFGNRVTNEQMVAFQQFAGAIGWGTSDLYTKIKLLTIPMFNGGYKDTNIFFNLKTGTKATVGQAENTMTIRDEIFAAYWNVTLEGAFPIYKDKDNEMDKFYEFTPAPKDFSIIGVYSAVGNGSIQNSNGVPVAVSSEKVTYRKYDGTTVLAINDVANDGIIVSSSLNNGNDVVFTKGTSKAQSDSTVLSSSGTLYPNYGLASNYKPSSITNSNVMIKVYGYAEGLTVEEARTLRDALNTLAEDLGWNIGYEQ